METFSTAKKTETLPTSQQVLIARFPITDVSPCVDHKKWPAYAFSGEIVPFRATAFREGHDHIGVRLILTDPDGKKQVHRMHTMRPGTDRWETCVQVKQTGTWKYRIGVFADDYTTWLHEARIKIPQNTDVSILFMTLDQLLDRALDNTKRSTPERMLLRQLRSTLSDPTLSDQERFAAVDTIEVEDLFARVPLTQLTSSSSQYLLQVQSERFGTGAWYEFFPRSIGAVARPDGSWQSGTFETCLPELERIAANGFSVVYLPPIHPIGTTFRKGANNAPTAGEHEPGSPWAIGSAQGGHDAIHPDLGDETSFKHFIAHARALGLEIAMDLALQTSPDHPWVSEHPEWFTRRADQTIAYAQNPPKKYQDIYPLNFDQDPSGLWPEILRIVRYWISLGVHIFRVDNPHTKPVLFWQWLIQTIRQEYPEIIFLSEAFTRPAMLHTLAKIGFDQSYTYFTWKNTKQEIIEYISELAYDTADFLRPNFFVNTPDILPHYLQHSGPAGFKIRAALAATTSPIWGVYSGYELCEHEALLNSEDAFRSEKYEYRPRDYEQAEHNGRSISRYLRMLNRVRAQHQALRQLRNIRFHDSHNEHILVYTKHVDQQFTESGKHDTIIVVINLNPHHRIDTKIWLNLPEIGQEPDATFDVYDHVTGQRWAWGAENFVSLDPHVEPVHILHVIPHTSH